MFFNTGPGFRFSEATAQVFGDTPDLARVIKARDLNGDGLTDIVVGTTYQTQSRLFLGTGQGRFREATATHLPADAAQRRRPRGRRRRWRRRSRSGARRLGARQQHDQRRRPHAAVAQRRRRPLHRRHRDADAATSGPLLLGSRAGRRRQRLRPRRAGVVQALPGSTCSATTAPARSPTIGAALPQYTNNYEFEPMDLDGDGFLDLVTINDGEIVGDEQLEPPRARVPQRRQGPVPRRHRRRGGRRRTTSAKTTTWWRSSTRLRRRRRLRRRLAQRARSPADQRRQGPSHSARSTCSTARPRRARSVSRSPISTATAAWTSCRRRANTKTRSTSGCSAGRGLAADTAPPSVTMVRRVGRRRRRDASCARASTIARAPAWPPNGRRVVVEWTRRPGAREVADALVRRVPVASRLAGRTSTAATPYRVCATDAAGNSAARSLR